MDKPRLIRETIIPAPPKTYDPGPWWAGPLAWVILVGVMSAPYFLIDYLRGN